MTPLERLMEESGKSFPALEAARQLTVERIDARRELLETITFDRDVAVVLMGSWGRAELTAQSDDDYMVLVHGRERETVIPSIDDVAAVFARDPDGFADPGREGIFGKVVFSDELCENIGLDDDTNRNLTRRMLLLLESIPIAGESAHAAAKQDVLTQYLQEAPRPFKPPRFLLNDIVRYWRTVGVDFAAKARRRAGEGWGLRNVKLRTSRKLLFASGLIPVLRCHELDTHEMADFLMAQLNQTPTDRLSDAFLYYNELSAGARVLDAYDKFLSLLDQDDVRSELERLGPDDARESAIFLKAAELGREIDAGLLDLLFGPALNRWTREYGLL
jgi:hypothetical protein